MSLFEGLGDELVDAPLVDDKQNEPVRQSVLGEKPPANPFSGLADALDAPDSLKPTLTEATKKNPDSYAKAARIAREQGVPPSVVEPSLEEFERHARLQKLNTEQMGRDFAVTAGFLRNFDNAAQMHDDIDTLTRLETWFKDKQSYLGGRFERGAAVVELGELQAREAYDRLGIRRDAPQTDAERHRIEYLNTLLKVSENADEQGQFFKMLGAAAEQFPILGATLDAGARPLAEGLAVGTVAGATAGTVAAAPTVLGTPAGTLTGAATGGLLGLRTMIPVAKAATVKQILDIEVGNAYNEFARETDEAGNVMDPQIAAYAAGAYGVIAAGLESLSLRALGKVFSGPKDTLNRTIKNKIKQVLKDQTARQKLTELGKNWAGLIATESITEALQEGTQTVFGELAKVADTESFTEHDLSKALDAIFSLETADVMIHAATEAARASVVFGAAGTVTTVVVDGVRSETRSAGEQRKIDELGEIVQNSKGLQRNPEALREFMQQAATEGDSVYLPAQPVLEYLVENGIDPYTDPALQGIAAQIDEASSLGGDVVVPLADFATSIAVSDHMEALRPHMRLSADTAAPSEVKAFQEAQQNWVNKLVEEAEAEATVFEEAQSVYEEVREKLVGTGRATEAVAKLQAQVIPAYVTRLAVATGRGVRELFDEMALQLSGPFSEQQAAQAQRAASLGVVLDQDGVEYRQGQIVTETENFKRWFEGSKITDENDNPLVMYHGTGKEIEIFDRSKIKMGLGFFFTKKKSIAKGYADRYVGKGKGNILPVYLSLKNPIRLDTADGKRVNEAIIAAIPSDLRGDKYKEAFVREAQSRGYDGMTMLEGVEYVVFDPTQIKSVFNRGTFDPSDPNILNQSGAESPRLSALHNLSSENLLFADKMGGLAVPSIGVVKDDMGIEGYGDITLIGTRSMADPREQPVFDADAYSTTFPDPEYKPVSSKVAQALVDRLKPFVQSYDQTRSMVDTLWDNATKGRPADSMRDAENANSVMAMFLSEHSLPLPKPVMRKKSLHNEQIADHPKVMAFFKKLHAPSNKISKKKQAIKDQAQKQYGEFRKWPEDVRQQVHSLTEEYYQVREGETGTAAVAELSTLVKEVLREVYGDKEISGDQSSVEIFEERMFDEQGQLRSGYFHRLEDDQANIGIKEVDPGRTKDALRQKLKGKEVQFQAWLHREITEIHGPPQLKVDGRKVPYTIDNIVAHMTSKTMTFGEGKARAAAATRFSDLQHMRNASYQLGDPKQIEAEREKAKKIMEDYREKLVDYYGETDWRGNVDTWGALDASMRAIAKFAKKGGGKSGLQQALRSEGFKSVPDHVLALGVEAKAALLDAPVPYFESKPLRVVSLDEFAGAVVPKDVDPRVIEVLKKHNIDYVKYGERFDETARKQAVVKLRSKLAKKGADVLFQDPTTPRGTYDVNANMIRLLEASDLSTFLHESAHFFLEMEKKFNPAGVTAINEWFSRNAAEVALEANKYLGQSGAVEQSAFHGSPHSFDKFTLQKIGTGEGAQAYGWGLYFAGSKEVAEWYRDKLSDRLTGPSAETILKNRKPANKGSNADRLLRLIAKNNSLNDTDIKSAGLEPESFGFEDTDDEVSVKSLPRYNFGADDAIRKIEYNGETYDIYLFLDGSVIADNGEEYFALDGKFGRLYHVELAPTDDQWLLWDKPLSEQSDKVKAALKKLDWMDESVFSEYTGQQVYEGQVRDSVTFAGSQRGDAQQAASKALLAVGIPGIEYLDGSSRGKGEGNYNYVLFDDSLVEITRYEQSQQTPGSAPGPITEAMVQQWLTDGATGDRAVDEAIKRATHEQFARGFETYLMEGKAPSLELREAFRAFARWLTDLYRKIKGDLNVTLDDQMRAVFDRLLATEDQIAAVEAANRYRPLFTDAAMAGMTEEEFADYQKKQSAPTDKAKETLQEKIFAQLKRETEGWWQEEKAERIKAITEQLRRQPVYNATETLREKGGEIKLDRAAVKEMLGVDRVPDQLRGMTLTGMQGVSPDDAAAFFGYASGHQMISEMMAARPIRQLATEQAEAEMKAEHGDILNDGTLEREAQDAAHNEERGKQILVELKALARSQNRPSMDRAAIKALAAENIGRLPLTRILPHKYRRAEIRAAQAAQAAMDKGDRGAALQAKMQQAMNFYLWRAAQDARDKSEQIVRFTRKYKKPSIRKQIAQAGNGYLEQIDGILERFEFDRSVRAVQTDRQDIAEWAKERADDGDNLQLTREVLSEQMRKHYREIPFDTLLGVYDSIRNIDHIARFANKVKKDGELLDFLEVKREVLAHLDSLPAKFKTPTSVAGRQTVANAARWHLAQMTKLPVLFTWLDGGKRAGLIHRLLAQPFTDAGQERQRLYREVGLPVVEAIRNRSRADRKRHNQKVHIPEAVSAVNDGTFMRHELISVALNTGNLSNLEKMLKGEGWVAADAPMEEITTDNPKLQAIFAHLTDSDWTLVETIWKQINQLFPLMAEVHKRTSGLELPKVEAASFTLPSGRKIAGGYYPMVYDAERGDRAEKNEQRKQAQLDTIWGEGGFLRPSASTGAKIERTSFFAPIRFSLDVVPNHVDEVIQYITHYEAVRQVHKLSQDTDIKKAMRAIVGKAEYDQILPWLNDIAKDGKESPAKQVWDPLLRRLRLGTTLGMMGFKASTGLMQVSGLSNSVGEVGVKYMARSMRQVIGALGRPSEAKAMWEFVTSRSKIMGDRINTMDRELMAAMNAVRGKSGMLRALQETSLKHIAYIQTYTVDLPTWYGAYYKGLDEAKAQLDPESFETFTAYSEAVEAQAVRRADWTVENVQGSGMTKDMARIQRNQTEGGRMLTMFFTFFSSMWNLQRDTMRGAASGQYGVTTLAAKLLFIYMVPVAYEMLLRGELEDDDDDTALEKYLTRLAIYPTATVPILRDIVNASVTGYDFNLTPVAAIIEKGVKGSTKVAEAMVDDDTVASTAAVKNTIKLTGALAGIPGISQAFQTGEHLYQVIEEGDELTTRELLFGPRRD